MFPGSNLDEPAAVTVCGQAHSRATKLFQSFLLGLLIASATAASAKLPFIQDNYAKARGEALQRKVPIFVECWAPW
ncbi:MAG TPA: hypothetical protein VFM77_12095 [Terriglobales bacterium]|nr:hypothetical protein [Terriglobales bacterium]